LLPSVRMALALVDEHRLGGVVHCTTELADDADVVRLALGLERVARCSNSGRDASMPRHPGDPAAGLLGSVRGRSEGNHVEFL
jgi:hypothetical protein